jgi:hypothetical protein
MMRACRVDDLRDIATNFRVDVNCPHGPLASHQLLGGDDRLKLLKRMLPL